MTFIEFIALSAINLGIIIFIIRKRSIASAEGLCMAYLGIAVATDNIELVFHSSVSPDVLPLGHRELAFRLYPTAVQIFGLLILIAGLWASDAKATPVSWDIDQPGLLRLRHIGIAITVVGLGLTSIALYLVGALSSLNFYVALNSFRSEALPFGGFWYRGADVAVFGMALTLPSLQEKPRRFFSMLALMMFVSFFLRTNKGGLEEPILWGAIVLFVYNRKLLRSLFNAKTVALALAIAFLGVGAKLWFLPRAMDRSSQAQGTLTQLVKMAAAGTSTRWGDDGLYRGYCQFVNTLPDNRVLFEGSKVGIYSLTSWVPRWFYPNKPDHPFRGLGFAIYSDFHTYPNETPAPMVVGSAMADGGLASLAAYLFLAGLFLGWFRRWAAAGSRSLYRHCGYLFFVLFGGFSAEEGTLGLFYTLLLAYGIVTAAYLLLSATDLASVRRPAPIAASIDRD
ncbi:MAG: hypothetical protein WBE86_05250 [Candidatus Acidiferrales bacterium]